MSLCINSNEEMGRKSWKEKWRKWGRADESRLEVFASRVRLVNLFISLSFVSDVVQTILKQASVVSF